MTRRVFFSFEYGDVQKAMTIRKSWVAKGKKESPEFVDAADFEKVKRKGKKAIQNWIDNQLNGTSVTVVLVGKNTSDSEYVKYEIEKSIDRKNGLVTIFINNIKDFKGNTSTKGTNPYPCCACYDWVNDNGYNNMGDWIEKAAEDAGR